MFDSLYNNIGGKIKGLAKFIFIFYAILSIILGLLSLLLAENNVYIVLGLLFLICGPIISWILSWFLYAFGELVEDVGIIRFQVTETDDEDVESFLSNNTY